MFRSCCDAEPVENSLALHVHGFGVVGGNGKFVIVPSRFLSSGFSFACFAVRECTFEWGEKWIHNGKMCL